MKRHYYKVSTIPLTEKMLGTCICTGHTTTTSVFYTPLDTSDTPLDPTERLGRYLNNNCLSGHAKHDLIE